MRVPAIISNSLLVGTVICTPFDLPDVNDALKDIKLSDLPTLKTILGTTTLAPTFAFNAASVSFSFHSLSQFPNV